MRRKLHVLCLVLILGFAAKVPAQVADPAPTPVLAYEGRLTESNVVVTGTRPFVFSILDSTGNELWNSGPQNLTVVEGLYGIVLGATGMPVIPNSLTLKANLHLHVLADGVALSPDISLIPALQASTSWSVTGPFLGDISGTQQGISVDKLKGIPIDLAGLTTGQVLTFDGTSWMPSTAASGQGPQGPVGPAGPNGATGPAGATGSAGATGATGPQGPAGVAGATGAAGTNGTGFNFRNAFDASASYAIDDVATFNGSTYVAILASTGPNNPAPNLNPSAWSVMAPEGAAGAAGAAGVQGPAGTAGATGAIGATGATGPQGLVGATGATGPTGLQGLQGLIGSTGATGATGAAGTNGTGFNFRNAFDASLSYAINDVVIFNGSSYVAILASAGPSNPTPDNNTEGWSVMAQQGATGATGVAGEQGATGTAGATGSTGSTGPQGLPGATGAAGATGPQGVPGIDGPQGATGAAGTNGTGFNFRNAFDASLSYAINDVVIFNGSSYVAIVASAGPSNPTPDNNTEGWSVMAQQGATGATGVAGEQGATGTAGATGSTGSTGPQGLPGATGAAGATGPQGVPGIDGPQGATGAAGTNGTGFNFRNAFDASLSYAINDVVIFNGSSYVAIVASAGPSNPTPDNNTEGWSVMAQQGATGATGAAGEQGATGTAGATGSTGSTGPQGLPGATGAAGATGPQGVPGIDGPQGATGAAGTNGTGFNFRNAFDASLSYAINDVVIFNGSSYVAIVASAGPSNPTPDNNTEGWSVMAQQGATGATGVAGEQGATGTAGATGSTGSTGPQGLPGATGAAGATGPQGVPGIDGPQGATGAAGTNGTGFNFRNAFDASLSYAINDVVIFNGSSYVAIVASAGPSNPTPDNNTEGWSVMAQQGATGATGVAGEQGATGTAGATGSTGSTGPQGLPGATGAAGSTGPQGVPGIDGPQGATGAAGTNGTGFNFRNAFDASLSYAINDVVIFNGSSYVAILASAGPSNPTPDNNTEGWSVMAQQGATGATGVAGEQGATGTAGATGSTGSTGPQGLPGATGAAGATGPQGVPGIDGPQGATGAAGTNGTGFNFRNAFDASLSYAINDVVIFNGSSYVAIVASAGPNNPTPDNNTEGWSVMAQQGATGATGVAGEQGATGTAGATGSTGSTGPQGLPGATGAAGATGPQGVPGIDGPQGATGAAGTNGTGFNFRNAFDASLSYAINDVVIFNGSSYVAIVASAGPSNPTPDNNTEGWSVMAQQGATGATGVAGEQGATGTAGATGSTGSTGPQGLPGATGAAGATGPQGVPGIDGPQGATGAAGTNGTGFNFRNAFDASLSYAINDVVIFNGSSYVAILASTGPSNPTPDNNTEGWSVMAQQGATGATGVAGEQGATGTAGATGSTGSTGPQGLPGATGAAGATGAQGAPGIDGATGATGSQGPAGASPFALDGSDAVFTTGSVGLGVDPPSNTAALDVSSTTKGLLAPRMTTVQRLAIESPANGLIVFDTDTKSLQVYDAVGAIWNGLGAALGTVQVAGGGTGATTLTGYLLGAGTSAITASTTIPGTAISGNISGNAANVTGTVAVTNGGTGATTLTGYLLGAGTSAVTASATIPGTAVSGNISGNAANVTGTVVVAQGGTGATTFAQGRILYGTTTTPVAGTVGMFWDAINSRLGVGTTTPSFPVDIETSVSHDFAVTYGFLNANDVEFSFFDTGNAPYSLYASNRIVANEFDAISDARSKHVIGRSDIASDLDTLKKLRITDYRYIDVVEKGRQRKKGVIAQELEKVYPDAVRITSDFIPSVYAMAVDTLYNEAAHELTVTSRKAHGFATGDMVRIITADTGNLDKPVAAVLNDDTFVLSGVEKDPGRVFVFGKKVDDFHVVDYDQLFSMNIGATQQLAAENQDLRARLSALEQAVALLQQPK